MASKKRQFLLKTKKNLLSEMLEPIQKILSEFWEPWNVEILGASMSEKLERTIQGSNS